MHAFPATGAALGFAPGLRQVGNHQALAAAAHHVPGMRALDLVADPHAARAQDAAVLVQHKAGVAGIYRQVRINVGEANVIDAQTLAERLQLAMTVRHANAAHVIALGEQHFKQHAPVFEKPRAFGAHLHAFGDFGGAGGEQFRRAFHFHQAQAAAAPLR